MADPVQSGDLYKIRLEIAGLLIELQMPEAMTLPDNFLPFLSEAEAVPSGCCTFIQGDAAEEVHGTPMASDYDLIAYRMSDGTTERHYHSPGKTETYAISRECEYGRRHEVIWSPDAAKGPIVMNQYFRMSGWEQMMIHHRRLLLHASCIGTNYGGILFSGPSGIGKSTQSDLWVKWRGARLINGDRPILSDVSGSWQAYGSPLAGSSQCYRNESVSMRAIVILEQGPVNTIRRMKPSEAYRKLYMLTTVYTWDQRYIEEALAMIGDLIRNVPVYLLTCTPDEEAVRTLEKELQRNEESDGSI